jgi:hypothetical protein
LRVITPLPHREGLGESLSIIVRAILSATINAQTSICISLATLSHLFLRKLLIPTIGTIDFKIGGRDIDKPLRGKA